MLNFTEVIKYKPFREVFVMGMYHSGTCALIRELKKRYTLPIYPRGTSEFHPEGHWKHGFEFSPFKNDNSVLVITLIKDPFFWIQSLKKQNKGIIINEKRNDVDKALLDNVIFNGYNYKNVIEIWNKYAKGYLNQVKFPTSNTLVVCFSDLLFRFKELQQQLDKLLPRHELAQLYFPPTEISSRPTDKTCRNRQEALEYYIPENRYRTFKDKELVAIQRGLDRKLMYRLGYTTDDFIGPELTELNLRMLQQQYRNLPYQHKFPSIHTLDKEYNNNDMVSYFISNELSKKSSLVDSYNSDILEYIIARQEKGHVDMSKKRDDETNDNCSNDGINKQQEEGNKGHDRNRNNNCEDSGDDSDDSEDIELEYIIAYTQSSLVNKRRGYKSTKKFLNNKKQSYQPLEDKLYNPAILEIQLTNNRVKLFNLHKLLYPANQLNR